MNRPPPSAVIAVVALANLGPLPFGRPVRYSPPADPGHFTSPGRYREHTADDVRAFRKRVAKRRAKKGYR